jgi:hypothetical protein
VRGGEGRQKVGSLLPRPACTCPWMQRGCPCPLQKSSLCARCWTKPFPKIIFVKGGAREGGTLGDFSECVSYKTVGSTSFRLQKLAVIFLYPEYPPRFSIPLESPAGSAPPSPQPVSGRTHRHRLNSSRLKTKTSTGARPSFSAVVIPAALLHTCIRWLPCLPGSSTRPGFGHHVRFIQHQTTPAHPPNPRDFSDFSWQGRWKKKAWGCFRS